MTESINNVFPGNLLDDFSKYANVPLEYYFKDADENAIDVSGAKIYLYIKKTPDSQTSIEIELLPVANTPGLIAGEIEPGDISTLDAGTYYYSLKLITSEDKTYTFDQGTFQLIEELNQRVSQ